jgi:hypothetical protein
VLWCVTSNTKWSLHMRACNLCDLWKYSHKTALQGRPERIFGVKLVRTFRIEPLWPCDLWPYKLNEIEQ